MALHPRQPWDVHLQVWRGPPAAPRWNRVIGLARTYQCAQLHRETKQPLLLLIFWKTDARRGPGSVTAHACHTTALPLGAPLSPCRPACSAPPPPQRVSCQWPPFSEHPELQALGSAVRVFKPLLAHPAPQQLHKAACVTFI